MSKSGVTVRFFKPEDSLRCRALFTEGMKELVMPVLKITYPLFFKTAVVLFVPVLAVALKWTLMILPLYLLAFAIMKALIYICVYLEVMAFINDGLDSDLLDIEKYYQDGSCMLVAEFGGRVIGMVGISHKEHHKPGIAELQRMSVCSSVRGKGTGTLLVKKVVEYCKEKKYDKLILSTTRAQYGAIALYKKCGFRHIRSRPYPKWFLPTLYDFDFEKDI